MILAALWKAGLFGASSGEKRTTKGAIRQALNKINAWLDEETPHQPKPKRSLGGLFTKRKEDKEGVPKWNAPL